MKQAGFADRLWRPVGEEPSHALASLEGAPLGEGRLRALLGPASRSGARYFQLWLVCPPSEDTLALAGMHHEGPFPGYNWVEVISTGLPAGDIAMERQMYRHMAGIIAPGGHIMVEYESAARHDTERALVAGVPPALTPLGAVLIESGFTAGFKDWYISEGWTEGPRKLQAHLPLNTGHGRQKAREMLEEAEAYLASGRPPAIPRVRAESVLERLRRLAR